jgi:membrane-associated phospholipid phosphatase
MHFTFFRGRAMVADNARVTMFGAVAGGAALGFALLAVASAGRKTSRVDRAVEKRAHVSRTRKAGRAARRVGPLVKTYTTVPVAVAAAAYVLTRAREGPSVTSRSREAGALAIVASALLTGLAEPAFDHLLPQPPVPGGRTRRQPVFPSGHTFKPTALALACAHVLSREGLAPRLPAFGVAVALPLASGVAKLVARKHWLSDVAGGVMAGVAIGSACCAAYELARGDGALGRVVRVVPA